ncbi:hypothetical protein LB528_27700 [Mesorhizobium sp. CA4]|nr:hypothetical protein [Mesorhizobium sp. CA4]MBZ9823195.1 hypothetical protein [Mesorhizobium sp. CA4]
MTYSVEYSASQLACAVNMHVLIAGVVAWGSATISAFVDYYDLMEMSPRATPETIERIFRYYANAINQETGDERRFST